MAVEPGVIEAQMGVLRILAPDLCNLIDEALMELSSHTERQEHRDYPDEEFCHCGAKIFDAGYAPGYGRQATHFDHECAYTRLQHVWSFGG